MEKKKRKRERKERESVGCYIRLRFGLENGGGKWAKLMVMVLVEGNWLGLKKIGLGGAKGWNEK